jgi:hypothetical protein
MPGPVESEARVLAKLREVCLAGAYRQVAPKPLVEKLDAPRPRGRRSA